MTGRGTGIAAPMGSLRFPPIATACQDTRKNEADP
jgi:hypothetical protein